MNRVRSTRRLTVVCAVALVAVGMAVSAPPALATNPPRVDGPAPQSGPTAGGNAVRIYGADFTGATLVKFGTLNATSYVVVDDNLITAVVPAASGGGGASNTSVNVKVTTPSGTDTMTGGYYYTNATLGLSTSTGLAPGDTINITLTGYKASTSVIVPEFNPLQLYLEGTIGACSKGTSPTCPPAFPAGPPPYAQPLGGTQTTTGSGGLSYSPSLPNPFTGTSGTSYDANTACPVNQTTADYLGNSPGASANQPSYSAKCHIAVGQFGAGTLETPISYTADPTPTAPTLVISPTSASIGNTINITSASSANFNANPFFGSSTTASNPGETIVQVKICGLGGVSTACSSTVSTDATVGMTRYKTSSTTTPITVAFSGAKAAGSIVVGADVSPCTCTVRVRQWRTGYAPNNTNYIEKTATLTIT